MANDGETAPLAAPQPIPAASQASSTNRPLARLWIQLKKAAIPVIVTAVLGYGGGFFIPPTAVYDWLIRQDPNDLSGRWLGAVAGSPAELWLTDRDRLLTGKLTFRGKTYQVEGNHDSAIVLEAPYEGNKRLKIGLWRKLGERYSPDDGFLLLTPDNESQKAHTAVLVCNSDAMDTSNKETCRPLGLGTTFFARKRGDPR